MGSISHTIGGDSNLVSFKSAARVPITSLKAYFKPIQEGIGDPSPENVRSIVGWDGVEVSHYDDIYGVPSNYRRVEYIRIKTNSYFDSNYVPIVAPKIVTKIQINTNVDADLFGFANNVAPSFIVDPANYGSSWYERWGATNYSTIGKQILKPTICEFGQNQIIDGTLLKTFPDVDWSTNTQTIRVGGARNINSDMNLYYCDIYDGTNLVRRLVPCRRKSDDVLGLYDMVNESFLTNQGTGTLECGPDMGQTIPVTFYENLYAAPVKLQDTTLNTSGEETSEIDMQTTGYISVTEGSKYVIEYTSTYGARTRRIMGYDSSNNFVDSLYSTSWATVGDTLTSTITIPSGVNKVKICMYSPDIGITFHAENPITVYGGYVDVAAGEVVGIWHKYTITGDEYFYDDGSWVAAFIDAAGYSASNIESLRNVGCCTHYPYGAYERNKIGVMYNENTITFDGNIRDAAGWKAFCAAEYGDGTPIELCYPLKVPFHYPLTPTQLTTLLGQNTFYSNTNGNIEISYAIHDSAPIRAAKHRIAANEPHIETVNGSLANFSTDMKAPLKSCKVYFSPVQSGSGDPSPSNVRAISGWTNLSLYHSSGENLYTFNPYNDGCYISTSGVITVDSTSIYTDPIPVNAGETYSFKCTTVSVNGETNRSIHGYNSVGTWMQQIASETTAANTVEDRTILATIPSGVAYIRVSFKNQDTNVRIAKEDIISADWSNEGNIYGGYVDLVSGEVVQEWYSVTVDGVTTNQKINRDYSNDTYIIGGLVYLVPAGISDGRLNTYVHCDTMPVIGPDDRPTELPYVRTISAGKQYLRFYLGLISEHPELDTAQKRIDFCNSYFIEHPAQIVYKLVTPIVYSLSPTALKTLRGTNNIWSNANGNISVQYWTH